MFNSESDIQPGSHILTDLECASGTTSSSPKQLLFILPSQYQSVFDGILVYEPGHWKIGITGVNLFYLPSFPGGVFTCRIPDESETVVDTSVGIFPTNYDKNSEWVTQHCV